MLDRHPDLEVVVDHGAKPDIAAGSWEPWASWLRAAAGQPRVCCKLSGLLTEAGTGWTLGTLSRSVVLRAETSGPQRL